MIRKSTARSRIPPSTRCCTRCSASALCRRPPVARGAPSSSTTYLATRQGRRSTSPPTGAAFSGDCRRSSATVCARTWRSDCRGCEKNPTLVKGTNRLDRRGPHQNNEVTNYNRVRVMNAPLSTAAAGHTAARAIPTVDRQFEELFDGVDDLIKRVADTENPEIRKIRAKVHASMGVAESACKELSPAVRPAVRPSSSPAYRAAADPIDEDYPGEAVGVALLVGLGLG